MLMEHEVLMRSTLTYSMSRNANYILEDCTQAAKFHHTYNNDTSFRSFLNKTKRFTTKDEMASPLLQTITLTMQLLNIATHQLLYLKASITTELFN